MKEKNIKTMTFKVGNDGKESLESIEYMTEEEEKEYIEHNNIYNRIPTAEEEEKEAKRDIERKKNLTAALKANKEKMDIAKRKGEIKENRNRRRSAIPIGERDYKWCDYDTTPEIEANFVNGKLVSEYSNGKLVR